MSEAAGQLTLAELTPELEPAAPPVAATEPTAEQRAAIAARERDAFLEAGAGSGKTRVLVDRYCAAVAEDGVDVDRILAFTFTERAAAEMRTRVRRELVARARAAADAGDADRADGLRRAARATERAWVLTIHAFCRRLLATHPLAAGLDPRFRVLDAAEAARLADRAAREALEELLASGDDDVARAAAAYTPRRLVPMLLEAHTRLRSQGMADPRLPDVPDPVHSPGRGEEQRALMPEELERARSARRALELLLERFHARYEALKDERSALDFQDLELRALNLLESSPGLASAWRERFVHVMVDEFQDTNSVQLRLIRMLSGSETRTFMVGDEHQSIYRFRNADLEVFRAERRAALESPDRDVLPLRGNFRSLPAVLATVNQVGRTLLEGFTELTVGRPAADGPGSAELLLTLDEGTGRDARKWAQDEIDLEPPPVASAPKVIAEARFLAQRLRELVDNEGVERGQIVVLLRAFTHVDAYEEALTRAGLRPFVVGGRGYWTQQQVEDLIRLLGVVSNPLDDEYLFGALASFANAVSPDALWLLRRAATSDDGYARRVWPVIEWRYGGGREPADHADRWLEAIDAEDDRQAGALLQGARRPAGGDATPDAGGADRADDERVRLRPRPDRPRGRRRADGERAQADAPRARLRGERGARPRGLPRARRRVDPARRARGHGRGAGGGARRGPGDDRARRQGARVRRGRRARPRAQARRRPQRRRHHDRPARRRGVAPVRHAARVSREEAVRGLAARGPEHRRGRRRGRGGLPAGLRRRVTGA